MTPRSRFLTAMALALVMATGLPSASHATLDTFKEQDSAYTPKYKPIPKNPAADLVGKPAPDFAGLTSEGRTVQLADFKSKMVVMEWHNPECPFVKKHYDTSNMQRLQTYARSENTVWLTINSGSPNKQGHMTAPEAQEYYK